MRTETNILGLVISVKGWAMFRGALPPGRNVDCHGVTPASRFNKLEQPTLLYHLKAVRAPGCVMAMGDSKEIQLFLHRTLSVITGPVPYADLARLVQNT